MGDNPNAFKHWIGDALLEKLAAELKSAAPGLDTQPLTRLSTQLKPLELKDRVRLVRDTLHDILPPQYLHALAVLLEVARRQTLKGFDLWPITEFVQTYGLAHFDRSMEALRFLTTRFTAEFAVRPFLKQHFVKTFEVLNEWAVDPHPHVRRAASEGSRPRLPWGERVPGLIEEPRHGLAVLEKLRFDPEIYVRRSVANHLNDISKDHPELVVDTLRRWLNEAPPSAKASTGWIVRHALRGLIKQGHRGALALVGVNHTADVRLRNFEMPRKRVAIGDVLRFGFTLESTSSAAQKIVVDYVIHFVNANGGYGTKVFKLKTFELPPRARVVLMKQHSLRPITTRTYYPGTHRLQIQINGSVRHEARWTLVQRRK